MIDGVRRFTPLALVGIIAILVIVVFVSLGRAIFSAKPTSVADAPAATASTTPAATADPKLTSTLADRSVRMTVRGQIVADENYRSYSVTISPDSRIMATYHGYRGEVIDTETLDNTSKAYGEFVYALDRANLMTGDELTGDANETRGICATGNLYEFEMLKGDKVVKKLWASSCSGSVGSLKANLGQVMTLFQKQIPDFSAMTSKMNAKL